MIQSENSKSPIHPVIKKKVVYKDYDNTTPITVTENEIIGGLTKREYFAAMAMQGLATKNLDCDDVAKIAVLYSDSLLKQLAK